MTKTPKMIKVRNNAKNPHDGIPSGQIGMVPDHALDVYPSLEPIKTRRGSGKSEAEKAAEKAAKAKAKILKEIPEMESTAKLEEALAHKDPDVSEMARMRLEELLQKSDEG